MASSSIYLYIAILISRMRRWPELCKRRRSNELADIVTAKSRRVIVRLERYVRILSLKET